MAVRSNTCRGFPPNLFAGPCDDSDAGHWSGPSRFCSPRSFAATAGRSRDVWAGCSLQAIAAKCRSLSGTRLATAQPPRRTAYSHASGGIRIGRLLVNGRRRKQQSLCSPCTPRSVALLQDYRSREGAAFNPTGSRGAAEFHRVGTPLPSKSCSLRYYPAAKIRIRMKPLAARRELVELAGGVDALGMQRPLRMCASRMCLPPSGQIYFGWRRAYF